MQVFFYQRITQNTYNNVSLESASIDWSLLLPASQTIVDLNASQVSSQIQAYVDLCTQCTNFIDTTLQTQTNLQIEQIQGALLSSISAINNFALQLLNAQNLQLIYYTTPYDMSLSVAMAVNGINLNTYQQQIKFNATLQDFNYIPQGTQLTFARS